jgi:hypothetical protein
MPVYPCPECGAQLRPQKPVPAGKKLRCPKCDTVFAPAVKAAAAATPAPAAAPAEEPESYGLAADHVTHNEDATRAAFDPIKDRFKRSARGPALVLVVKPSTWLLRTGVATCVMAIAGVLFAIWPMIFKIEIVQPAKKGVVFGPQTNERKFQEMTEDEWRDQWLMLAFSVFQFGWGAVICAGAAKMHELNAYPLAMVASIMALVSPFVPVGIFGLIYASDPANDANLMILPSVIGILASIPFSIWCISTLRNKQVIAGFQEEKPEDN